MGYYYHAGTHDPETGDTDWSNHTRRTAAGAEKEARRMCRGTARTPIVEYWERRHGLRPGDCELVLGAYEFGR